MAALALALPGSGCLALAPPASCSLAVLAAGLALARTLDLRRSQDESKINSECFLLFQAVVASYGLCSK